MSRYGGLDKIEVNGLTFIEKYGGAKIYECTDNNRDDIGVGHVAVKRGYAIDSQVATVEFCRDVIDHFNAD